MSLKVGDENVGISQGVSPFVCLLSGSKKAGMSQEVSLVVVGLRDNEKLRYPKECHHLCAD